MIDRELLDVLACPVCKTGVTFVEDLPAPRSDDAPSARQAGWLLCGACGRCSPVRDGVPVMLAEEAAGPAPDGPAR